MTTPMKATRLINSRIISPRSPTFLSTLNNTKTSIKPKLNIATCLFTEKSLVEATTKKLTEKSNNFKLEVTDYDDCLLLNTPNRSKLLKHGVSETKHDFRSYLGRGTFGTVIKSKYRDNMIAVKVIKTVENMNEINVLNLSHKNIVRVLEIITNQAEFTLILMEYCDNSLNLQNLIDNFAFEFDLNQNVIVKYARDICEGMRYCHANGILHLDIKPKNVLLCEDTCKICDFGNSYRINEKLEEIVVKFKFKGTVAYTSPEILSGLIPTTKCDVYSFGILLWQMITRKNPYENMDNEVVIYKVVKFNYRPDSEQSSTNSKNLLNLCKYCWDSCSRNRPEFCKLVNIFNNDYLDLE